MTAVELTSGEAFEVARFGMFETEVLNALAADMPLVGLPVALGPIRAPRSVLESVCDFLSPLRGAQPNGCVGEMFDGEAS